jgi:hypothetical protein
VPKGHFEHLDASLIRERSELVRRMAFQEGLSIKEIAAKIGNISESRVGQILNTRDDRIRVLMFLEKQDGPVDIREVAVNLDMGINKAQFLVDTLKKRGQLTADVGKRGDTTGDHRAFTNIRLKKRQHGKVTTRVVPDSLRNVAPEAPAFVQERIPEQLTNGKDHGHVPDAEDQKVEEALRTFGHTRAEVEEVAPELPEDIQAQIDSGELVDGRGIKVTAVTEPEELLDLLPAHDIPRFPILASLLDRDAKIGEAARLLEQVGLDDLAIQALQNQDKFTELEREYMKFARAKSEVKE